MALINSALGAAVVGAVTSVPIGLLAHRYKWQPFEYDNAAQAAAFAAGLGALNAIAWYWGIERYMRENQPTPAAEPPPGGVEL